MSIKRKYKSTIQNQQYLFKNGKSAHFVNGEFLTGNALEIAELDDEISNGIPFIYYDENDKVVDTTLQDRIKEAQTKAALEVMKEHEKGTVVDTKSDVDTQAMLGGAASNPGAAERSGVVGTGVNTDHAQVTGKDTATVVTRPSNATLLSNLHKPAGVSPEQKSTGIAASTDMGGNEVKL